ncbi:ABC transporter permease [Vibrio cholerae]|uniref:ABC transporter permease n=3 Tax=Vibrio cholerae TaxID=666 RepID=UPI00115B7856|nr:ABC transporter permease [Vibrio cholerae]EJX7572127.1 ABC transporter permease [Vibrio cholerae]MCR9971230.1 ABC transporter permease [Vibrio cholerae]MDQ4620943.1 ABC transporter permease [Vibrio cholerae]MDQ4694139.1 ABC transporter permease [Vibrio cholerae]TQP61661.1 ABC transporter permease [Vibrio cholerae]
MSFFENRELIFQIAKRNVYTKYKGSVLGICWSFLTPLFLLTIYTFVFGYVFKTRWGDGGIASYPVILFSGLIFHFFFTEVISSSTQLISSNGNYVKKVVFPLDILVMSNYISQFFGLLISFVLLTIAIVLNGGNALSAILAFTIITPPFALLTIGLSYLISSLGVFIRDIVHIVNFSATILLFASPILFPVDTLPSVVKSIVYINPISYVVSDFRAITFGMDSFSLTGYVSYTFCAAITFFVGKSIFNKLSKGFSDVV